MANRTKHKTKIIHRHPRKGPSNWAVTLAYVARGIGAVARHARREMPAHAKQGPMFGARRAGPAAKVGPSRGGGGPMGAEPKGFRPAWGDGGEWGGWQSSRPAWQRFGAPDPATWRPEDGDDRDADERIDDLRAAGYDGDIDADGYPLDDSGSWDDVDHADWTDTCDKTADSGTEAGTRASGGDAA